MADVKLRDEFKFDAAKCKAHLDAIEKEMQQYAGKPGYNPFLWLAQKVAPLRDALANGDTTEALQSKVLALKASEPKV